MFYNFTLILILNGLLFIFFYFYSLFMNRLLMSANYRVYEGGSPLFFLFLAPGVVVHELSHALVCKILGVKIYEFKPLTFEKRGNLVVYGYVKREQTNNPIKEALISTAPIYIGLLILTIAVVTPFISIIGGVLFSEFRYLLDVGGKALDYKTLSVVGDIISIMLNIWLSNRIINPMFWVIPYISLTIILSSRPSSDDLEMAFKGIIYIGSIYLVIIIISIFTTGIKYLFYGFFEFLLVLLVLTLSLSIIGSIFLIILYLFFRIKTFFKVIPLLIAVLSDILTYPMFGSPISTSISLLILIVLSWFFQMETSRSFQ